MTTIEDQIHNSMIRIKVLLKDGSERDSPETETIICELLVRLYKNKENPRVSDLLMALFEIDNKTYGIDYLINKLDVFVSSSYLLKISEIDNLDLPKGLEKIILYSKNRELIEYSKW